ncbi:MAG: tetratricopeptide repeat protein, partial [Deltaproteobacteria bacterium]|nr:tetratricopeptide repeat protein [Deltaproteobacteria bacterium]
GIAALEDSLRLADDVHTRLDLAGAFAAVERYPSALPHLRKAVQIAPRDPVAWAALAETLVKVEKPEGAVDSLRESQKVCPRCTGNEGWNRVANDVAHASVAKAEKQIASGDVPGARKSVDGALVLRPKLPEVQLVVGKVARAEGDTTAATSAFRNAVEQTPDAAVDPGAGARLELATLLSGYGKGVEAVTLAEQVGAARGDDGAALDTLGRACDATRNTDCARKAYGRLVKLPAPDGKSKGALDHARLRMKALKVRGKKR